MLKLIARCLLGTVTLFVVFAGSSALAANVIRPATGRAVLPASHARKLARSIHDKRGAIVHSGGSHDQAVAASTVLLGEDAVEPQSDFLAAGRAEAFSLQAGASGVARTVHIYIDTANAAQTLVVGLYTNVNGHPGVRLRTASVWIAKAGAWATVSIYKLKIVSGATYWLAILGKGGTLRYRDRAHGPCESETSAQSSLRHLPSSWRSGTLYADCPVSAYVTSAPPPPINTGPPTLVGSPTVGVALSATTGAWKDTPTAYAYQWQECNALGVGCLNVGGATTPSLMLTPDDVGGTVRNVVTASNETGSTSAASEPSEPIASAPQSAPTNTAAPTIGGTAQVGDTLTADSGTWTEDPTSITYQWEDCNTSGKNCSNVSGATAPSYQLASSDVGHTVRVVVSASNEGGSASAASEASEAVAPEPPPPAPTNTVAPAVSGTAQVDQILTASNGTWSDNPTSFSYQWQDCNSAGKGCSDVSGATASTYQLASSDVGHTVRVVVTASSEGGSTAASSAATALVTSPLPSAPTNTVPPSVSGSAVQGGTLTASAGTWTESPTSLSYQWEDCTAAGESCSIVSKATSATYELISSDVGHTVRVVVTASNAGGSESASSAATAVVNAELPSAPASTALPSVSGTAEEGQTLSASNGSWTGSPTFYAYQWEDCNSSGSGCSEIGGATSSSYKLLAGDVGHTARVVVTATNAGGSAKASSEATSVVVAATPARPASTALPSVSGTAEEGQTLSASNGSWSGSPTSYAYQWQDCNGSGSGCSEIGGATSSSYKLLAGDVGHTVRVVVTATNAGGSAKASSEATSVVVAATPAKPASTALPKVSGVAEEGQTLTATEGSWTGSPSSFAYQWEDCNGAGEACAEIAGANSSSYKLVSGDVGHTLRAGVTATNAGGSTKATSQATATVAAVHTAGPQIYVAQSGAGGETGESCASARSLAWLNSAGDWGSGADRVGPGTTVDLCGTLTQAIETQGSGEAGEPITIVFTAGSKIAMAGNGCPGAGCINLKSGSEFITVTSVAGYKGQIENTERSYARDHEEGPGTKGVKAFGCRHCNIENLEIGPLYVSEKGDVVGDTEIQGITIDDEDGEPEYDTIQNNYLHDLGWAVNVQNGAHSGHIYVEGNTFYHLTHGLYLGANAKGSVGQEVFAHNRLYGNSNWEDGEADTNHVDGVHCAADEAYLTHYTGLYIYDNYITTEGANTTGPIFLEGSNGNTPCADKTSNIWIFDNVLTGDTCCGLAAAFSGEVHTYDNTMIGEGTSSEYGERETCETWNSDTKGGRLLTMGSRSFKNNVVTSCHDLISAERFLAAPNGMEHNLWANAGGGNEVFACERGEVETGAEGKESFYSGEFGSWATCMEQPETESRYLSTAKLELTGQAQAPLGEPESGSEAIGHGKNLSSLCSQTPEEALCKNIDGETRSSAGPWNIGAY